MADVNADLKRNPLTMGREQLLNGAKGRASPAKTGMTTRDNDTM